MITILIFLAVICSGSAVGAAAYGIRFEKMMPITCIGLSAVIYFFGLCGALRYGAYFTVGLAAALYIISITVILKRKNYRETLSLFFSPGFLIFVIAVLFFISGVLCLVPTQWDDYSHWMFTTKTMTELDDFITNDHSQLSFKFYPPMTNIFEYLMEKLNIWGGSSFSEWKATLAFQILGLSILIPFTSNLDWKKKFSIAGNLLTVVLLPVIFYPSFLVSVMVDPIVGIMAGAGLAAVLTDHSDRKDYIIFVIYETMICFALVLTKATGLFFAALIMIAIFLKERNKYIIFPALATVISKVSWTLHLVYRGIDIPDFVKGTNVNILDYTRIFLFDNDTSYKGEVVRSFKDAFFTRGLELSQIGLKLSFFALFVVAALSFIWLSYKEKKKNDMIYGIAVVTTMVYVYSLGGTYLSNFGEYEATNLASYERYMCTAFLPLCMVIVFRFIEKIDLKNSKYVWYLFIAVMLLISPMDSVISFMSGQDALESQQSGERNHADYLVRGLGQYFDGNDRIYVIAEESKGYEQRIMQYLLSPNYVSPSVSIGRPFYTGDVWTREIDENEWMDSLIEEDYDYVVIYKVNSYFIQNFKDIFEDGNEIAAGDLYQVDAEQHILRRIRSADKGNI